MKDVIIQDIITAANFKLAGLQLLLEKEAAGKGGISNPMGGSSTSTATKGVKTAPVMSAAPINDLLPKATTAQSAGLPALTQLPTANQGGMTNNAVLPMFKSAYDQSEYQHIPPSRIPEGSGGGSGYVDISSLLGGRGSSGYNTGYSGYNTGYGNSYQNVSYVRPSADNANTNFIPRTQIHSAISAGAPISSSSLRAGTARTNASTSPLAEMRMEQTLNAADMAKDVTLDTLQDKENDLNALKNINNSYNKWDALMGKNTEMNQARVR